MAKIIAFSGGMGVGKSTAIEFIKALGYAKFGVENVKFAAPLYEMQEAIYHIISPVYKRPAAFVKDRKLLQWLGTEWGRDTIRRDLWTDLWVKKVKAISEARGFVETVIVCDDCRFDNEAQLVKSMGGTIIKITSDRAGDRINTAAGIAAHKSEGGLKPTLIDYTIENNGSKGAFLARLYEIFEEISVVKK